MWRILSTEAKLRKDIVEQISKTAASAIASADATTKKIIDNDRANSDAIREMLKTAGDDPVKFRMCMPNITPHVCRHTYCSNQAKAGMYPKTLQYLMGHSDISVTMNTYTHLGLEDAVAETNRVQQLESARKEQAALEGRTDEVRISKKMFRVG